MLDLLFFGSMFIVIILALLSLRLAYFRGKIASLQGTTGARVNEANDVFEKALSSEDKFDRRSHRILDLVARLNAWKDNDRKLEKAYKRNRGNEKSDTLCILPSAFLIFAHYSFEYLHIKVELYNLLLVVFSGCFLGYTLYTFFRSYRVVNTMEDKLGIGRRQSNQ